MSATHAPAFAASLLRSSSRAYAAAALQRLYAAEPQLLAMGLPRTFAQPIDDLEVRILHLAEAIGVDRPALLQHAVGWYKVAFHHRGVPGEYLAASLDAIGASLRGELPAGAVALVERHLGAARAHLAEAPVDLPSHIQPDTAAGRLAGEFLLAVLEGRGEQAMALLRTALAGGASVAQLHDEVLIPAQRESGRMWLMGEIPIADEHYGSAIVDRALWMLQDHVPQPPAGAPTVVTLGVGGNLHDFGLRVVAQRLQAAGYRISHLGSNMPANDLEWAFADRPVDLVAISATLLLHLHTLAQTVDKVRQIEREQGRRLPVLVGGEVFGVVPDLHLAVGADAGAASADGAVAAARRLLGR